METGWAMEPGILSPVPRCGLELCVRAVAATQVWLLNLNVAISKTYSEKEHLP